VQTEQEVVDMVKEVCRERVAERATAAPRNHHLRDGKIGYKSKILLELQRFEWYAIRDSNPEPTDYGFTQFKVVLVA